MSKKVLLTYGTFDMFHIGHARLLKRLKKRCDYLIVGLSTDEFNEIKGKKTLIPYKQRKKILESIKYVDKVIPEKNWNQKIKNIKKYNINIFAMGDDWKGKFDDLEDHCEVLYLKRTKDISTSQLKKSLSNFLSMPKDDIINAFEILEQLKKDLS